MIIDTVFTLHCLVHLLLLHFISIFLLSSVIGYTPFTLSLSFYLQFPLCHFSGYKQSHERAGILISTVIHPFVLSYSSCALSVTCVGGDGEENIANLSKRWDRVVTADGERGTQPQPPKDSYTSAKPIPLGLRELCRG